VLNTGSQSYTAFLRKALCVLIKPPNESFVNLVKILGELCGKKQNYVIDL
jgi:hypothetical protein